MLTIICTVARLALVVVVLVLYCTQYAWPLLLVVVVRRSCCVVLQLVVVVVGSKPYLSSAWSL